MSTVPTSTAANLTALYTIARREVIGIGRRVGILEAKVDGVESAVPYTDLMSHYLGKGAAFQVPADKADSEGDL